MFNKENPISEILIQEFIKLNTLCNDYEDSEVSKRIFKEIKKMSIWYFFLIETIELLCAL